MNGYSREVPLATFIFVSIFVVSCLKGKNLLLGEQILSFKSRVHLERLLSPTKAFSVYKNVGNKVSE